MSQISELLRSDLQGRVPYGAPQIDVAVRLNTNENTHPLPDAVTSSIEQALSLVLHGLNRYPDRDARELRSQLASYLGGPITTDQVWAANGSNEILQQLLQAFGGPGRTALGFTPAYSMHPIIASAAGTQFIDAHRDADFNLSAETAVASVRRFQPDVVFVCSPNNPTGTALAVPVLEAILDEAHGLVVIDEAYAEFARDPGKTAIRLLPHHQRLVVTRTMSKAFGFAGVRLGYLAADPEVVAALQLVRLPYHLSSLTQAAAIAALENTDILLHTVEQIKDQRDRIVTTLGEWGLTVAPSDANFVLFGGLADAPSVWRSLIDRGVLVRDVGLPGWLRVTAGTETETSMFLHALEQVLKGEK